MTLFHLSRLNDSLLETGLVCLRTVHWFSTLSTLPGASISFLFLAGKWKALMCFALWKMSMVASVLLEITPEHLPSTLLWSHMLTASAFVGMVYSVVHWACPIRSCLCNAKGFRVSLCGYEDPIHIPCQPWEDNSRVGSFLKLDGFFNRYSPADFINVAMVRRRAKWEFHVEEFCRQHCLPTMAMGLPPCLRGANSKNKCGKVLLIFVVIVVVVSGCLV